MLKIITWRLELSQLHCDMRHNLDIYIVHLMRCVEGVPLQHAAYASPPTARNSLRS